MNLCSYPASHRGLRCGHVAPKNTPAAHFIICHFICCFFFTLGQPRAVEADDEFALPDLIRSRIELGAATLLHPGSERGESAELDGAIRIWYGERAFAPFWIEDGRPSARAHEALRSLAAVTVDGLEPEDYSVSAIRGRWESEDPRSLAELELLLTAAVTHLSYDAQLGRPAPRRIDAGLTMDGSITRPELLAIGREVLSRSDIERAIQDQFPRHRQYRRMKTALAELQSIAAQGGWGIVSGKDPLKMGDTGPRVAELKQRLAVTGDLPRKNLDGDRFGVEEATAVRFFQQRHGLPTTGEVHALTLAALNVPIDERIRTLVINLERWRWLARDFSAPKEVFVNIAGYELFALHGPEIMLRLPVIVGKAYHATPVFSSMIRSVEANPYWNVPPSIARNEILPKLGKDPSYLAQNHMKLFPAARAAGSELSAPSVDWHTMGRAQMNRYAIRQEPGPWNALGTLKFVFPNSYSVYLHDTPNRKLFADQTRAFSHGCIRVSRPSELAVFLLDRPEDRWTPERIQQLIDTGRNQGVKLAEPVRIHLTYRTAWVDLDGAINFRPDVYKRDAKVAALLFARR